MNDIKRGEIYYADLSPVVGSEQGGIRPVVIIQNNIGNKYSPTTIVAIITSRKTKANIPTHVWVDKDCGLPKESMIELEQIRTIDKSRLKERIGKINEFTRKQVDFKIRVSLGV